ncbi:MAG: peptidylprolyl isomerase [Planctomycetales bacterium]|nr:peptidylprolyl isomerase [Planctomycetales bacterium]
MNRLAPILVPVVALAAAGAARAGDPPPPGLACKLEASAKEATLGDVVDFTVTVANESADKTLSVKPPEWDVQSVFFNVTWRPAATSPAEKPAEKTATLIRYHPKFGGMQGHAIARQALAPGKSLSAKLPLFMLHGGEVKVEAVYNGFSDAPEPGLKSAAVTVQVTAPPKARVGARIETSLGNLEVEFFPDIAPGHVENFLDLARTGFYKDTRIARIVPKFVIQGGDPKGNLQGSPGYSIAAEFNPTKHVEGILSMARETNPHTGGCQFFICLADVPGLDNQYTAFGKVAKGLDVLRTIARQPTGPWPPGEGLAGEASKPKKPVLIKKVTPILLK